MRLLIIALTLLNIGVYSQYYNVPTVNDWDLINFFGTVDETKTRNYFGEQGQIFSQYGLVMPDSPWGAQAAWRKEFWDSYYPIPDSIKMEIRLVDLYPPVVRKVHLAYAVQDSVGYNGEGITNLEMLDTSWKTVSKKVEGPKFWGMQHFGKFYLIFVISPFDSGYTGASYELKNLRGIYEDGSVIVYDTFSPPSSIKDEKRFVYSFTLEQNYPNPFNPSTKIDFRLTSEAIIDLRVYNLLGQEVAVLIEKEIKSAGNYSLNFNAEGLPSGTYIYRLISGNDIVTRKMILLR